MSDQFAQLLKMAEQQTARQRLLFLFASTQTTRKSRHQDEQKGTIEPVMVVDKLPDEVTDFKSLVDEADSINKDWNFVFIASLSGDEYVAPTSEESEPYLNKMTNDVVTGSNIMRYVVFDRDENPIEVNAH